VAAKVGPEQWSLFKAAADVFIKLAAYYLGIDPKQVRVDVKVLATKVDGHLDTLAKREDFMYANEPGREVRWGWLKVDEGVVLVELIKLKQEEVKA
jgi:hypothetical protein